METNRCVGGYMNNMAFQAENGESFISSNTEKSYLCCARRQSEMFGNEILEKFFSVPSRNANNFSI